MNVTTSAPAAIDTSAVYIHENGMKGRIEDWAEDPDGSVKVRIKDTWLFLKDLQKLFQVRCPHCSKDFEIHHA